TSAPYTHEQNGVAERLNRTLQNLTRAMLTSAGLSDQFWAEGIQTAMHIRNHTISHALDLYDVVPLELWTKEKPDISHFHIFGCTVYVLNKSENLAKFAPRADKCIFVGYDTTSKAYRLWCDKRRRII